MAVFVLVHGAWHGAWCWVRVADRLRRLGHRVTTPTQTGLGERRHLLSPDITLETFVTDVVNHIEAEELEDIVLVGHSFGGIAIAGAADRIPERIRHLVFLDSRILPGGRSIAEDAPQHFAERRARLGADGGVSPPGHSFGVPDGPDAEWVRRRVTPHPFGTYVSPLDLANPIGNGRPRTYIACTAPLHDSVLGSQAWVRSQPGWGWRELATGHDAMITAPDELAALLVELAG